MALEERSGDHIHLAGNADHRNHVVESLHDNRELLVGVHIAEVGTIKPQLARRLRRLGCVFVAHQSLFSSDGIYISARARVSIHFSADLRR